MNDQFDRKYLYFAATAALGVVFMFLFLQFGKYNAKWWGVPVWIIAIAVSGLAAFGISCIDWVNEPDDEDTPYKFMVIPLIGAILCMALGIYFTEPIEGGYRNRAQSYNYANTRAGHFYYYYFGSHTSSSDSSGSSSVHISTNKDTGKAIAFLIIIVLVVIVVVLSALVPHFWLLGTLLCLVLAAVMVWRQWKVQPYMGSHYRYGR